MWRSSANEIRLPSAQSPGAMPCPVGCVRVAANLEVLAQRLAAHGATLMEQCGNLLERESVPLDSCRVMGLLEPDVAPDAIRLSRRRQPAQPIPQLRDLYP